MRAGALAVYRAIATAGLMLLAAGPAAAVDFGLAVYADGVRIDDGNVDETRLGCVDNPDGVTAVCNAEDLDYGGTYTAVQIDIEDFFIDSDPVVTGTLGVTNTASTPTHFTFVFTLPVTSMPGPNLSGGRISGTLTDQGGGGATVSTAGPGTSFYTALIDAAPYGGGATTLYDDPTSFAANNNSTVIPQLQFGTPIPSFPAPAVVSSIGIQLDFILTGFDQVSFTSNHVVVPEPGTAALLGLGLVFLARRRRS